MIRRCLLNKFVKEIKAFPSTKAAKEIYDSYLYHFTLYLEQKDKLTDHSVKMICNSDSSMLIECPIITVNDNDGEEDINKKILEALKHDLVILRGFLPKFNFNNEIFNIEYIEKNCDAKNQIDVIEQDKDFFGFLQNRHTRKKIGLLEYLKYVRSHETQKENETNEPKDKTTVNKPPKKKISNKERLLYGVNIELTEYPYLMNELEKKIHPLLLFGSSYDSLAYVRNHIKGMTVPQMYIKVPGVWTGGHEENLRMRSINICHGPGKSYWWASPTEDSQKLVEKVQQLYGMNIYKKEGIWFPDVEFFITNKIKVFYTVQEAGDIVLVGPGTIHWVRAVDKSINTSWNFSSKENFDLKCSMDRYEINKIIKLRSLVPMLTLIMDLLNSEMFTLSIDFVKCCSDYLIPTVQESINRFEPLKEEFQNANGKYNLGIFKEDEMYMVENCEVCLKEIFNIWAYCQICSKAKEQFIVCLDCFRNHLTKCYNPKLQFIFYKYETKDLLKFLERLNFRLKFNNQIEAKDLSEPQKSLQKCTNDNKIITEKMKFKIVQSEDFVKLQMFQNFFYLYKNFDTNEISSLLIPLIDSEKLTSDDFKMPLKAETEIFINPYIEYSDLYHEEYNKIRFSPSCLREEERNAKFMKNSDEDQLYEWNNMIEINSNNGNGRPYSLNSAKMSPRNSKRNIFKKARLASNSNLPGKAFFADNEADEEDKLDIRSNKGILSIRSDYKCSSMDFYGPSSPRGVLSKLSLISDNYNLRKLKDDLINNSKPVMNMIVDYDIASNGAENEGEKEINSLREFGVLDVFNGMFTSSSRQSNEQSQDQNRNSLEEVNLSLYINSNQFLDQNGEDSSI